MDKKYLSCTALLSALLFCIGCIGGGTVKQNIAPSHIPNVRYVPVENTIRISGIKRVAIFPFADYSHQQGFLGVDSWGGNIKIIEEITDYLLSHGISVAVQEDVNTLLVDNDIIRPINKEKYLLFGTVEEEDDSSTTIGTPEYELAHYEHSPTMVNELVKIIKREKKKERSHAPSPVLQGSTVGLSRERVVELAKILGVDMIIRGRIIEYGYKDIGTLNPLYRGFVPVIIDSVKDILFGTTASYGYERDLEDIESILMGAGLGYAIGHQITNTSTSTHSFITRGIVSRRSTRKHSSSDDYAAEGAGIGAVAGWWASQHPKKAKRSTIVQVRIYAQDAKTGDVLWSNRSEIEYVPKSNFAYNDTHPKTMFDKAVKEGVKVLMDNFFAEAEDVFSQTDKAPVQKQGF